MGRPVGGASAVGCGVFGVAGLLVGVALTVWLGSQVTSSIGSDRKDDDTATSVPAGLDDVADLAGQPTPGLEPQGAAIRIDAPADLGDGGTATVIGTDLAPGPIELALCLTGNVADGSDASCDPSTTVEATVGASGELRQPRLAPRVITVGATAYDCAARAGACSILGYRTDNPLGTGISAPLTFATGLPPVEAVAPPPD